LDNSSSIVLVVLPFGVGLLIKILTFVFSSRVQRSELNNLLKQSTVAGNPPALDENGAEVVLTVLGMSTQFITAGSTFLSSMVAFLVIALRHHQGWLRGCWISAAVLAIIGWTLIYKRKQPYKTIMGIPVGTFVFLACCAFDVLMIFLNVYIS
jgi:hypothetical protein